MRNKKSDQKLMDRKKELDEQIQQLRQERTTALADREKAKEAYSSRSWEPGEDRQASDEFKNAMEATRKVGEIEDGIETRRTEREGLLEMLGQHASETDPLDGSHQGERLQGIADARQMISSSAEYMTIRQRGILESEVEHFGTIHLGQIADRDHAFSWLRGFRADTGGGPLPAASPGDIGTFPGGVVPDYRGIIPPALMNLSMLDLIPTGTTDSNLIHYVQVVAVPGSAAETDELATKPQEGLATQDATAPVRTIAGFAKLGRQSLADIAGLGTLINGLLPWDVRRRLLFQLLSGDGSGVTLTGLFNTSGINDVSYVAGDNVADTLLRAATAIILSDMEPNFVAVHPSTWEALRLMRVQSDVQDTATNTGAFKGAYLYGAPNVPQGPTIWGLPITTSRAVPASTPLVGDATGCSLLVREGVNVRTSDSDQDDFVKNRVTVLAEMRAAFVVWRPAAFAIAEQS